MPRHVTSRHVLSCRAGSGELYWNSQGDDVDVSSAQCLVNSFLAPVLLLRRPGKSVADVLKGKRQYGFSQDGMPCLEGCKAVCAPCSFGSVGSLKACVTACWCCGALTPALHCVLGVCACCLSFSGRGSAAQSTQSVQPPPAPWSLPVCYWGYRARVEGRGGGGTAFETHLSLAWSVCVTLVRDSRSVSR